MKKFFFSVITFVAVLFSSCSNNANDVPETASGSFVFSVDFADGGTQTRVAASSNAIPVTSWDNIKKMWMFLYDKTTGTIAYAYELDPSNQTEEVRKFPFSNIPSGEYRLAVVANVNHSTDNIATTMDGGTSWSQFDNFFLRGRKMNEQVKIDLKPVDLPTGHTFFDGNAKGFASPSEVFVDYADVTIVAGETNNTLVSNPLKLTREVSLMRVRLNKKATYLNGVDFNNEKSFVAVQNNPQGLGLKVATFDGGIFESVASDPNRILIGASGVTTFKTQDPSKGYSTTSGSGTPTVLDEDFTLWQDIIVLPNSPRSEQKAASADASLSRKYTIIISAWAPKGYELSDGSKKDDAGPVYWSGVINEVFLQNNIREVNLTFKSRGSHEIPVYVEEGGIEIQVSTPEPWNSVIQRTDKEI